MVTVANLKSHDSKLIRSIYQALLSNPESPLVQVYLEKLSSMLSELMKESKADRCKFVPMITEDSHIDGLTNEDQICCLFLCPSMLDTLRAKIKRGSKIYTIYYKEMTSTPNLSKLDLTNCILSK